MNARFVTESKTWCLCFCADLAGKAEQEPSPLPPLSVRPALPLMNVIHIYTQASRACEARSGEY